MIDTIRIKHVFNDIIDYNKCYSAVDSLARKESKTDALHRTKKKHIYITTAFSDYGLFEIRFFKQDKFKANVIQLNIKPSRIISHKSYLLLSNYDKDYDFVRDFLNKFFDTINDLAKKVILPHVEDWIVSRIDYAFDIETPYVREYINFFKRGSIPTKFRNFKDYDTSIYLTSKHCRINFYDKISELKDKYSLTDSNISAELGYLPPGILRLEIQCESKKIQKIKEKYNLPSSSIHLLWNELIASDIISHYVKAIVGKENSYPLKKTMKKLQSIYNTGRTFGRASMLIHILVNNKSANLADMKKLCSNKNDFKQLIFKIRSASVNPIVLDAISHEPVALNVLTNPYNLIQ